MFIIPDNMSNEESKFVAAVVVEQRLMDIAMAKYEMAHNRLNRYYKEGTEVGSSKTSERSSNP